MQVEILVGTRKGVFSLSSADRRSWKLKGPFLAGKEVNHAVFDPRTGRLLATANDVWFGSELMWSSDEGGSWTSAQGIAFGPEAGKTLERIWHIAPDLSSRSTLFAGVAPAALFRSDDRGESWAEVEGLSQHPTRSQWQPGAGGMCLHSIVFHPKDSRTMWVAVSAAGVFRTEDGGHSWMPVNRGVRTEFLPERYPEFGQCVHKLLRGSDGLYQQNHCGVYRSQDEGDSWQEISEGLPSDFGFPLAIHPHESSTIYVIPLKGAEFRCPTGGKLAVFRSRDGGASWEARDRGLPERSYSKVLREAMTTDDSDPAGIYFGTDTGKVFGSLDGGDEWFVVADDLPRVFAVSSYAH